ncbi:MAG: GDSL-type esterase/lipase family protein [Planctomycetota bacterium]|nr:GDSL-type esterase/lipase family protein [Planctomycetota bacterium]
MGKIILSLIVLVVHQGLLGQEKKPSEKWEKSIQGFEALDQKNPPQQDSVLFLGSSSIRMWKLTKWFPQKPYLNRGFGGSEISDSIYFFDRIVKVYRPRTIVFYAGDNDIAKGKSAQKVFEDFKTFSLKVEKSLPETKIVFVAIKPSLKRWQLVNSMREANNMIARFASGKDKIVFADVDKPMIGKDGLPKEDLFLRDGLHMNEDGYQVWYDVIHPLLK